MQLPNDTQRHLIIGRTGSGKTTLAVHLLSLRSFDKMPWVIANFKDDELINAIPYTVELDNLQLPKKMEPGIYIARPDIDDWDGMERLMREMWERTHNGLFLDEALAISAPKHPAFRRILTQGRSRRVPVIAATQRPVDIDRYAFSESEFISVMQLSDDREAEKIYDMTGVYLDTSELPVEFPPEKKTGFSFHSYYLDRIRRQTTIVQPVPDFDHIISTFDRRLSKTHKSHFI